MTLTLPWDMDFTSFISFEDDLLDFHRIEELEASAARERGMIFSVMNLIHH